MPFDFATEEEAYCVVYDIDGDAMHYFYQEEQYREEEYNDGQ